MTIYTVHLVEDDDRYGISTEILGSFTTRGDAIRKCMEWILGKFDAMPLFAWAMANDENHDIARFFSERRDDGRTVVARGQRHKLEEFIKDVLGGQGCYHVYDGKSRWDFNIEENDVEGFVWQTVTWGDSDTEDPEFTTPWPETFTSEETAVETFIDYVKDLYGSHHMKWSDKFLRETRKSLKEDGKVQVNLNDGTSVSCVLYRSGANNIKE